LLQARKGVNKESQGRLMLCFARFNTVHGVCTLSTQLGEVAESIAFYCICVGTDGRHPETNRK